MEGAGAGGGWSSKYSFVWMSDRSRLQPLAPMASTPLPAFTFNHSQTLNFAGARDSKGTTPLQKSRGQCTAKCSRSRGRSVLKKMAMEHGSNEVNVARALLHYSYYCFWYTALGTLNSCSPFSRFKMI